MDAQGAVDSLLGCLTAVLVDEAQLLGGVRGDVQFIKDEMECTNSVLLHVGAWMKQVVGLARDCEGYAELYVRRIGAPGAGDPRGLSKGLLGCLRRLLQLRRTIQGAQGGLATRVPEEACRHPLVKSSFRCKALVDLTYQLDKKAS